MCLVGSRVGLLSNTTALIEDKVYTTDGVFLCWSCLIDTYDHTECSHDC